MISTNHSTNPRVVYEEVTGNKVDPNSETSVRKYCQWLELELAHKYEEDKVRQLLRVKKR